MKIGKKKLLGVDGCIAHLISFTKLAKIFTICEGF
jgi:hypothetical protein